MAVSVMTFDSAGDMRNRYTFAEGSAKINFGEEIVRVQDISFKTKSDDKKPEGTKPDTGAESAAESSDSASVESSSDSSSAGASGNDSGFGAF